jgi:hypothetical protein
MKKLLVVALLAASFVGMAEARRCGRSCAPVCAPVCAPKCAPAQCIGPARICEVTYSNDCSEGEQPDLCYLVPARRNINKHVHRSEHITYTCGDKPACAVEPTPQQVEELRNAGSIPSTCG